MDVLELLMGGGDSAAGSGAKPDPAGLGQRMTTLYRVWCDQGGVDLVSLTEGFLERLSGAADSIGAVCRQLARDLVAWGGHPYHSANHHAEVATNAMVLAALAADGSCPLPLHQQRLLLASGLAHDIYYQPAAAPRPRFAAEAVSADALDVVCRRFQVPEADRTALRCLVLATEPGCRTCLRQILSGDAAPDAIPQQIIPLLHRPDLACTAAILSDADLLSSVGLSESWHDVQVERLQQELGHPISPADDLAFMEHVVGASFLSAGGGVFLANLERIGLQVRRAAAATD